MAHTLLLADDSITIQRVIELTFAGQGITVMMASDGDQAVERLKAERPDLVMVAAGLPKRDGYEVANFVQSQPALQGVPVLLLSGAFDIVDEARVRESGVAGVLIKPLEPGLVINRVKELLGMSAKTGARPVPPPVPDGRLITPSEVPDEQRVARPPMHEPAFAPPRAAAPVAEPDLRPERPEPSWDQLRNESGLGAATPNVESAASGGEDYFDQLDAAFDTLDAQLAGRPGRQGRAPAAPMPRMPAAIDPGRRPAAPASEQYVEPGAPVQVRNPVFEVDAQWFGQTGAEMAEGAERAEGTESAVGPPSRPSDRYGEVSPKLALDSERAPTDPEYAAPAPHPYTPPVSAAPVFEPPPYQSPVQQPPIQQPFHQSPAHEAPTSQAPASHAQGYQQPAPAVARPEPPASYGAAGPAVARREPPASYGAAGPAVPDPPASYVAASPAVARHEQPVSFGIQGASSESAVADAFAALFAEEQGEPLPPPLEQPGSFDLSDYAIERIAARVADRLTQGLLGETVTRVVTEVSERLVREEIARIRAAASQRQ